MTITDLVRQRGANLRIFDMGRRIQPLDTALFEEIEQQRRSYPVPYLKHAWLALLSWHPEQAGQHAIWFLKLPLDEQNLLDAPARDGFVRYVAQRQASGDSTTDKGEAPFSFKPDGHRMAYFHALAQPAVIYRGISVGKTGNSLGCRGWLKWLQDINRTTIRRC